MIGTSTIKMQKTSAKSGEKIVKITATKGGMTVKITAKSAGTPATSATKTLKINGKNVEMIVKNDETIDGSDPNVDS